MNRFHRLSILVLLASLLSFSGMAPRKAQASVPFATLFPTPYPATDPRILGEAIALKAQRDLECPIARSLTYYISKGTGASDSNDGLSPVYTSGTHGPWTTLAKAAAAEADLTNTLTPANGGVAFLFRDGDSWAGEMQTLSFSLTATAGASPTTVSILDATVSAAGVTFPVGANITLSIGAGAPSSPIAVASYNGTGTITLGTNSATAGYTTLNVTYPAQFIYTKPNITVSDYNDGTGTSSVARPYFSGFATYPRVTGWTENSTYPTVYQRSETGVVAFFREQYNVNNPYFQCSTIAQVASKPGSWFLDQTAHILYVHARFDASIGTYGSGHNGNYDGGLLYEYCYVNGTHFVFSQDFDGERLHRVRAEGFNASLQNNITSSYVVQTSQTGTNGMYIDDCEFYYASNHDIGHTCGGTGGIETWISNRAGWDATGDSPFVDYSSYGQNEGLYMGNVCVGAKLPYAPATGNGPYAQTPPANVFCFLAHSSSATQWFQGMMLLINNSNVPGPYQAGEGWCDSQVAPAFTDLAQCKFVDIGERFYAFAATPGVGWDHQIITAPLTPGSQTTNSVTLTTPTGGSGTQSPPGRTWITLGGGGSDPETIETNAYTAGTGVTTFFGTIAGSGRTYIQYDQTSISSTSPAFGYLPTGNCVLVNSRLEYKSYHNPTSNTFFLSASNQVADCVCINDTFDIDLSATEPAGYDTQVLARWIIKNGVTTPPVAEFYNSRFHVTLPAHTKWGLYDQTILATSPTASALIAKNCIFDGIVDGLPSAQTTSGTGSMFEVGIGDNYTPNTGTLPGTALTNQINNAYGGVSVKTGVAGYDQDPFAVELPGALPVDFHPGSYASALESANYQLIYGRPLLWDADGKPRGLTTQAIGPYEPVQSITPSAAGSAGQIKRGR